MMKRQQQLLIAAAFFFIWTAILYAGADHPPPAGFLWFIPLALIAAGLVYARLPAYAQWAAAGRRFRLLRVILEGAAAGLFFALIPILLPLSGELLVQTMSLGYLIWFVVLAAVGMGNAILVYCAAFFFRQHDGSARDTN